MTQREIDFLQQLISRAQAGDYSELEIIKNKSMYKVALIMQSSLKKVVKYFKALSKAFFKQYLTNMAEGKPVVELILQNQQVRYCRDFYIRELTTINYMIKEYRKYLANGHALDLLFGLERKEEDLVDYNLAKFTVEYKGV